jgi:hypothetical protein
MKRYLLFVYNLLGSFDTLSSAIAETKNTDGDHFVVDTIDSEVVYHSHITGNPHDGDRSENPATPQGAVTEG